MKRPEEMSDKELAKNYATYHQKVEQDIGGKGTTDLRRFEALKQELRERPHIEAREKLVIENTSSRKTLVG